MTARGNAKRKQNEVLDVKKVLEDFQREEESSHHRKDAFKIDKPFEKALDAVLKSKPAPEHRTPKR